MPHLDSAPTLSPLSFIHYYLSHQLAYRAARKLLHPCLSLASLWMVPQLWFTHFPSYSLPDTAATKFLRPCLSLASLWMVPQLWFMFFISVSTVFHQVVFGQPRFCFPSGVQWIATLVMELTSLRSSCRIQGLRFLLMVVSIYILLLALC